jgi:hypothetical protein
MTPEQTETVALEAKAWKGKDGRRAMTMLDVELEKGERLHLTPPSVRSGNFWAACRATARWTQIPDALAVEFLKARARCYRCESDPFFVKVDNAGKWVVGRSHRGMYQYLRPSGKWLAGWNRRKQQHPTESHALIAAVLASKESR